MLDLRFPAPAQTDHIASCYTATDELGLCQHRVDVEPSSDRITLAGRREDGTAEWNSSVISR